MTDLSPGTLIADRYRVIERLGKGGFGAVYRADQRVVGITLRQVAVKVFDLESLRLPPTELLQEPLTTINIVDGCPDAAVRDLFVFCFDAGIARDAGGLPYIAMEYVRGMSLIELVGRPMPVRQSIEIFTQVARALAYMHSLDPARVHRDIHPGNILMTSADKVKLADFGCASAVDRLLRSAGAPGMRVWQAPEALALKEYTTASEVYSLGLVLYTMLAGRIPYSRDVEPTDEEDSPGSSQTRRLLEEKMKVPERPSKLLNLELRDYPALEDLIMECVDPVSSVRPGDAGEFLKRLDAAVGRGRPVVHRKPTEWDRIALLIEQAEAAMRRNDLTAAAAMCGEAKDLNDAVPDSSMVAKVYPLLVRVALASQAGQDVIGLAQEGLRRRKCADTYLAAALAYEAAGHPAAPSFRKLAMGTGK